MNIENNQLNVVDSIGYEDIEEFLELSEKVEKISIETNDIHPSVFQVLFCISKQKDIEIQDPFNKKFLDNLKFS
jgi:hypothetical protein